MHRTSGVLLHPTSLPGPYGIGDLGDEAYAFVDYLQAAGQGLWQVLPLGPTGYRDSPYQCLSSFAGNPLLISPRRLLRDGLALSEDLTPPDVPEDQVDFGRVSAWKQRLLKRVHARLRTAAAGNKKAYLAFCVEEQAWLDDFALFAALKEANDGAPWTAWEPGLRRRDPAALAAWADDHAEAIDRQRFIQFLFFSQWRELRAYANAHGVRLIGDVPIFVAHDSAEVWAHPQWFHLDALGQPSVVAGVPPDYFSETGQRWGNPLYRWDVIAADGYGFWIDRLRAALALVDMVRIDHFRGFAANWEIPGDEDTAVNGKWVAGPGMQLFDRLKAVLGKDLPLIAEDLGVITPDVEALRDGLALPGMAILQFGFECLDDGFGDSSYLPHNHSRNLVCYTGTHDNNTVNGWWGERDEDLRRQVRRYLRSDGVAMHWDFIRAALGSPARMALFPAQELLGLGVEATMNVPGRAEGNWIWRMRPDALDQHGAATLRELSELFGRKPFGLATAPTSAPPQ